MQGSESSKSQDINLEIESQSKKYLDKAVAIYRDGFDFHNVQRLAKYNPQYLLQSLNELINLQQSCERDFNTLFQDTAPKYSHSSLINAVTCFGFALLLENKTISSVPEYVLNEESKSIIINYFWVQSKDDPEKFTKLIDSKDHKVDDLFYLKILWFICFQNLLRLSAENQALNSIVKNDLKSFFLLISHACDLKIEIESKFNGSLFSSHFTKADQPIYNSNDIKIGRASLFDAIDNSLYILYTISGYNINEFAKQEAALQKLYQGLIKAVQKVNSSNSQDESALPKYYEEIEKSPAISENQKYIVRIVKFCIAIQEDLKRGAIREVSSKSSLYKNAFGFFINSQAIFNRFTTNGMRRLYNANDKGILKNLISGAFNSALVFQSVVLKNSSLPANQKLTMLQNAEVLIGNLRTLLKWCHSICPQDSNVVYLYPVVDKKELRSKRKSKITISNSKELKFRADATGNLIATNIDDQINLLESSIQKQKQDIEVEVLEEKEKVKKITILQRKREEEFPEAFATLMKQEDERIKELENIAKEAQRKKDEENRKISESIYRAYSEQNVTVEQESSTSSNNLISELIKIEFERFAESHKSDLPEAKKKYVDSLNELLERAKVQDDLKVQIMCMIKIANTHFNDACKASRCIYDVFSVKKKDKEGIIALKSRIQSIPSRFKNAIQFVTDALNLIESNNFHTSSEDQMQLIELRNLRNNFVNELRHFERRVIDVNLALQLIRKQFIEENPEIYYSGDKTNPSPYSALVNQVKIVTRAVSFQSHELFYSDLKLVPQQILLKANGIRKLEFCIKINPRARGYERRAMDDIDYDYRIHKLTASTMPAHEKMRIKMNGCEALIYDKFIPLSSEEFKGVFQISN